MIRSPILSRKCFRAWMHYCIPLSMVKYTCLILCREEKEMATHSSVLAWGIPGSGEPGGLPSMGSHGVGHDWSDLAAAAAVLIRRIFQMRENKNYIWSRFDKWTVFFKRSSSYHQQFKHFNLATQGFKYSLFDTMHSFGRKPMTGFLEKVKI